MTKNLQFKVITVIIFLISLNCSNDTLSNDQFKENFIIEEAFSLDNYDDIFIKENLEINWKKFNINYNEHNTEIYEFNSYLKVKSHISDFTEYKLLAVKNMDSTWGFELIKFVIKNETDTNNLSYFSMNKFTGSIYHYNLKGENTLIKIFEEGIIIHQIEPTGLIDENSAAKAPPIQGGQCGGCWSLVRTAHYIDWYTNSGGGSTLFFYSHSTYNGTTSEWVYDPYKDDGYYGMPYDANNDTYHNHYDHLPGSKGRTNNHKNEKILEDEIINNLTDPCAKAIFSALEIEMIKKNLLQEIMQPTAKVNLTFAESILKLFNDSDKVNLSIANGKLIDANGRTTRTSITISESYLKSATSLSIARTMIHEMTHAYINTLFYDHKEFDSFD